MNYKSIESLETCINESHQKPICILKHSTTCPTSFFAKQEVDQYLDANSEAHIYLLIVQKERPLSNEIAGTFNVRHESPQLLIIKNGSAEKVFNHGAIQKQVIETELNRLKAS